MGCPFMPEILSNINYSKFLLRDRLVSRYVGELMRKNFVRLVNIPISYSCRLVYVISQP